MKDIRSLTANDILSIDINSPERLFTKIGWEKELKILRSIWHPDRNPGTDNIFAHIQSLASNAEKKINDNIWNGPSELEFFVDGKTYRLSYKKMQPFELGNMYISSTKVCYVVKPEFEDLFRNGVKMIQSIKYPDARMENEFRKYIPNVVKVAIGTNIGHVLVLDKTTDMVLLDDLVNYLPDGKIPPRHVMWMISSLSNQLCFFEMNNIAHLGITPQTVFVSPQYHSCILYGGWWYSRPINEKMIALPAQLTKILPSSIFSDKLAKSQYDRHLVKALGLYGLGDKSLTGSSLLKNSVVPKPILDWLRAIPTKSSITEYSSWDIALTNGFGKRTFVVLDVNVNDIY